MKPRVLFVGRSRLTVPLEPWLAKKWDAVGEHFEFRVLSTVSGGHDDRFVPMPDPAPRFYARLVPETLRQLRTFRPDVIIATDPFVAAAASTARTLARSHAKLIVEVHGEPMTFTRLYGSRARRALSLPADVVARRSLARADATRALSRFTSSVVERARGVPATATFPTYSDLSAFADPPPVPVPEEPRVVFVGALERYKNVSGLAEAWTRLAPELPGARLTIIGKGSQRAIVDELVRTHAASVTHHAELGPAEVAAALDASRALVLPSWPEGLGRVVLEAFARGRTVVATDAGGIPDIVTDGRDGILIPPADTDALVAALRRVLTDRDLAVELGAAARQTYAAWHQTADDFAEAYRALVDRVLAGAR